MGFVLPSDCRHVSMREFGNEKLIVSDSTKCVIDFYTDREDKRFVFTYLLPSVYGSMNMDRIYLYLSLGTYELFNSIYDGFINDGYNKLSIIREKIFVLYCKVYIKGEECSQEIVDYVEYLQQTERCKSNLGDETTDYYMQHYLTPYDAYSEDYNCYKEYAIMEHYLKDFEYGGLSIENMDEFDILVLLYTICLLETDGGLSEKTIKSIDGIKEMLTENGYDYERKPINLRQMIDVKFVDFELETV